MAIQWQKQTRVFILIILLIISAIFTYLFKDFIKYLSISALMAFILAPLKTILQNRFHLSKKIASAIVFFGFLLLLIGGLVILIPLVFKTADELFKEVVIFQAAINTWANNLASFSAPLAEVLKSIDLNEFTAKIINPEALLETVTFFTENIFVGFMIFFVMYYLILDYDRLFALILTIIPKIERPDFETLLKKINRIWRNYLKGQLLLSTILAAITLFVDLILGMPGAAIIVAFTLILTLIPSFGTAAISILAGATAAIVGSSNFQITPIWFGLLTLLLMQGIHFAEVYWLRPRLMGKSMRLHPAVIIIAVIAALSLSGVFLVLIIIPLLSSLRLLAKFVFARMVGVSPWEQVLPEK